MLAADIRENLCALIDAFCEATGLSEGQASKKIYGNTPFFALYREGKQSLSVKTLDRLIEKFRADWPPGAEWPHLRAIIMDRAAPAPPKPKAARAQAEAAQK